MEESLELVQIGEDNKVKLDEARAQTLKSEIQKKTGVTAVLKSFFGKVFYIFSPEERENRKRLRVIEDAELTMQEIEEIVAALESNELTKPEVEAIITKLENNIDVIDAIRNIKLAHVSNETKKSEIEHEHNGEVDLMKKLILDANHYIQTLDEKGVVEMSSAQPEVNIESTDITGDVLSAYQSKDEDGIDKEQGEDITDEIFQTPKVEEENVQEDMEIEESDDVTMEEENITDELEQLGEKKNSIDNLIGFEKYSDYFTAYRSERIGVSDVDKFYADLIDGVVPADMLTHDEFYDEKRRQLEEIKHQEEQEEILELQKKQDEKETQLKVSNETINDLERQRNEIDARLKEEREKNVELSKENSDLKFKLSEANKKNKKLAKTVDKYSTDLKNAQDEIFGHRDQQLQSSKQLSEKIAEIEELKRQLAENKAETDQKDSELEAMKQQLHDMVTNVTSELDRIKDEDSLETAAREYVLDQVNTEAAPKKETKGPKHMKVFEEEPMDVQIESVVDDSSKDVLPSVSLDSLKQVRDQLTEEAEVALPSERHFK